MQTRQLHGVAAGRRVVGDAVPKVAHNVVAKRPDANTKGETAGGLDPGRSRHSNRLGGDLAPAKSCQGYRQTQANLTASAPSTDLFWPNLTRPGGFPKVDWLQSSNFSYSDPK